MQLAGIDIEFIIFGLTLAGVALFHTKTLQVAAAGLVAVCLYKLFLTDFNFLHHAQHEWRGVLNLFGLLIGFTVLADHFEHSGIPAILPRYLPDNWMGPFLLLVLVFVLSAFLDSIAAVMIGGGIAHTIFRKKVHVGYVVGIVAASNAGGSGSVLGNITTTMMWVEGVAATDVLHAYMAAVPALVIAGLVASLQQHRYQPIMKDAISNVTISKRRLLVSFMILLGAIVTNIVFDLPVLGVWLAIAIGSFIITTHWHVCKEALPGAFFLLALVISASMMPVEQLPAASWQTAFGLGFVSAVFDNIPLTKLALAQGGYDWGVLAFTVGFGGSIIWFGSSAGVAICGIFKQAQNVKLWLQGGWYVAFAYVISFFIMLGTLGWNPHPPHKKAATTTETTAPAH